MAKHCKTLNIEYQLTVNLMVWKRNNGCKKEAQHHRLIKISILSFQSVEHFDLSACLNLFGILDYRKLCSRKFIQFSSRSVCDQGWAG